MKIFTEEFKDSVVTAAAWLLVTTIVFGPIDSIEAFRLFQIVKSYEISIRTVPEGNLIAVALLPSNEVLETQVVPGTTFEDAQRAMRLANQLVKQLTQKNH